MILSLVASKNSLRTERLEVRHPVEADRPRFVELFCDESMIFSGDVMSEVEAKNRLDRMLAGYAELSFAK